jgi:hypothetical protein
MLPVLDNKTPVIHPNEEEERWCDVAADALAEALDLDGQYSGSFAQDDPNEFLDYVRASISELEVE